MSVREQLNLRVPADLLELVRRAAQVEGVVFAEWCRRVLVRHARQLESLNHLRANVYGRKLDDASLRALIDDVSHGRV